MARMMRDGETWRVRGAPLDFELRLEERSRKYSSSIPPLHGAGQIAK
jgi:hypothetical protein